MKMSRVWAMANKVTFSIKPIGSLVQRYLSLPGIEISIDPFARDCNLATYTNDLNPSTSARYHLDVLDFLQVLVDKGVRAQLVIFDPPYSPRQIKECYNGVGRKMQQSDAWRTNGWSPEKNLISELLDDGGYFLYFGWNTTGMCKSRGFEIVEFMDVCHGPGHNDTLCLVERKKEATNEYQVC